MSEMWNSLFTVHCSAFFFRCKEVQFSITTGEGKFFSNGLDLSSLEKCTIQEASQALTGFAQTLSRIITFPVPTIAALNGMILASSNCF